MDAFKLVSDFELHCQLTARYCGPTHQTPSLNIADIMSWYNMSTRWQLPRSEAENNQLCIDTTVRGVVIQLKAVCSTAYYDVQNSWPWCWLVDWLQNA